MPCESCHAHCNACPMLAQLLHKYPRQLWLSSFTLMQATSSSTQVEAPYCDFAFVIEGEFIPLHRAILAARSKFFRKSLQGQWQPKVRNGMLTHAHQVESCKELRMLLHDCSLQLCLHAAHTLHLMTNPYMVCTPQVRMICIGYASSCCLQVIIMCIIKTRAV